MKSKSLFCIAEGLQLHRRAHNPEFRWQQTWKRLNEIERFTGAKMIPVQECAFDANVTESMRAFNNQFHDTGPLDPREAFFGGRVHPTRMYSPPSNTSKKCHKDIVSLYPSVLLKEYPVAHPQVHHCDWKEGAVNWTKPEDVTVRGLIKCIVSPPEPSSTRGR